MNKRTKNKIRRSTIYFDGGELNLQKRNKSKMKEEQDVFP
jgi:hypothetical protein